MRSEWKDFVGGKWDKEINVRDFIQRNYHPYDGDESFLAEPTQNTKDLWAQVLDLQKQEREAGGVLDMDTKVVSTITSHGPGYLQALVGQLYDNPKYSSQRDSGFQIFYVFINIGGLIAPFVAPMLRSWWLGVHNLTYNAQLPELCHKYLSVTDSMNSQDADNLMALISQVNNGEAAADVSAFCSQYLEVFNTGIHYSFIASVAAMLISLTIFLATKKILPTPAKKEAGPAVRISQAERKAMAGEIRQRLYALLAVLAVVIFFWFSFHQNGTSLSLFARDFCVTDTIAPEIWQAVNPFFVIVLTPLIMLLFSTLSKKGIEISTPRKIAIGMGLAAVAYLFLMVISWVMDYPSADIFKSMPLSETAGIKAGPWVLIVLYFFLTVAELFISPLGLSFVSKVAPSHMQGLCQGLWLGATAVGNLLLPLGPLMYNNWSLWICWGVFMLVCIVSMGVMFGMVKWLERVTSDRVEPAAAPAKIESDDENVI